MLKEYGSVLFAIVISATLAVSFQFTRAASIAVGIDTPEYLMTVDGAGYASFRIESFSNYGIPGTPALPHRVYNIALPPGITPETIAVSIEHMDMRALDGTYLIRSVPPLMTLDDRHRVQQKDFRWNPSMTGARTSVSMGEVPVDGFDESLCPESPCTLLHFSRMGEWRFLAVDYTPFLYSRETHAVYFIEGIVLAISFEECDAYIDKRIGTTHTGESGDAVTAVTSDTARPPLTALSHRIETGRIDGHPHRSTDERAKFLFHNYETAKQWYGDTGTFRKEAPLIDYCIITTEEIREKCEELPAFQKQLEEEGHGVKVITERTYGAVEGQYPNEWADKIRKFLQEKYRLWGIKWVLIIGNPAARSEVMMKKCYPYGSDADPCPTDYYYADLTGNWDHDGDGFYGEYDDDLWWNGVDFVPEVYVGRIPLYYNSFEAIDNILRKTIDYRNANPLPEWRKKVLMPEAFIGLENENNNGYPRTDGAQLAVEIMDEFLNDTLFTPFTLFEKEGLQPSEYECDADLNEENVVAEWSNGYGITIWNGHGGTQDAWRIFWAWDDGDSIPENGEIEWQPFFVRDDCWSLDNSRPSFVYQSSCGNGKPEDYLNLGYTLLRRGGIGTVSASRFAIVYIGETDFASNPTAGGIGYRFVYYLTEGYTAGEALYTATGCGIWNYADWAWHNYMTMNLYGDPGVGIFSCAE
jgi:hypothetical protein